MIPAVNPPDMHPPRYASDVSASYKRQAPTEDLSKDPEKKIADSQNKQGVAAGQAAANL